jgi:hypothetical protein
MPTHTARILFPLVTLLLSSCSSSGPPKPRTGTPGYYWQVAIENWDKADFEKTGDWLGKIGGGEFAAKALPFRITLITGLIRGNSDLADQYEIGARANKANPMKLYRLVSDYRGLASRMSLNLLEVHDELSKANPSADVPIDFPFPSKGTAAMPPGITKIQMGQLPTPDETITVQNQMLRRAMLQQVSDVVGAAGDGAKAQALMKNGPIRIPRATFELAMANALYNCSVLFSPRKSSDSVKQGHFLGQALKAVAAAGDSKEAKELKTKIEKDQKELKARAR